MKVLVTGGAGYIGAHIVRHLEASRHTPIILDDLRRSSEYRVKGHAWENVALEDTAGVLRVFEKHRPDAVIHLAGYISVGESTRDPDLYWGNNLGASMSLILACSRMPVKAFLFSSTAAVYGYAPKMPIGEDTPYAPTCAYGSSKLAYEQVLHSSGKALGLRTFALRYFNACGNVVKWGVGEDHEPEEHLIPRVIRAIKSGKKVQVYGRDYPTPDGTCVRDYIHVLDLASAHVRVIEEEILPGGQSFNVGTGKGFSVLEVIQMIGRCLKITPDIEFLDRRAGDPPSLIADPSKLLGALKWEAAHSSLEAIVTSAIEWENIREKTRHA